MVCEKRRGEERRGGERREQEERTGEERTGREENNCECLWFQQPLSSLNICLLKLDTVDTNACSDLTYVLYRLLPIPVLQECGR